MFISAFIMSEKQNHKSEGWYKQKALTEFLTREGEKPKKIHKCLKVVDTEDISDVSTLR